MNSNANKIFKKIYFIRTYVCATYIKRNGPCSARLWSVQYPFQSLLLKWSGVKWTVHGSFFLPYTVGGKSGSHTARFFREVEGVFFLPSPKIEPISTIYICMSFTSNLCPPLFFETLVYPPGNISHKTLYRIISGGGGGCRTRSMILRKLLMILMIQIL